MKRGIEIGRMAIIDVENGPGLSLEAVQMPVTPKGQDQDENSVIHHLKFVLRRSPGVESLGIKVGAFYGYFAIEEDTHVFSGPAYSISLNRIVRIVYYRTLWNQWVCRLSSYPLFN